MIQRKTTIQFRKPVSQITDRAKRYRANHPDFLPADPKQCGFCGSVRTVEVEHISGNESDGARENLMWACRSCNVKKANLMRRNGLGKKTRQYNAGKIRTNARATKAQMDEYGTAIKIMRGDFEGDVGKAVATIRATPPAIRSAFTRRSWPTRKQLYGASGRQSEIPF